LSGALNMYSDIVLVFTEIFFGFLMDLFGRKWFSIIGLVLVSLVIFITPITTVIYPALLLCTIGLKVGAAVGLNSPLTVDYVAKESMGFVAAGFALLVVPP